MLDIDIEPRVGILFVRLSGTLTKENCKKLKKVDNLLKEIGIRNVVFNISNLKDIDANGKEALKQSCEALKTSTILFCVKEDQNITEKISFLLDKIGIVEDELAAARKINV